MGKLRVKDVISPIDGIFTKMPDDIWGEFIDSEDLDIELYTKYGELLATPLVRFYNENEDLDGLAGHLYRKHSRSWEQIARALYEEYNMFLTSRMNEKIINKTEEDIKGTNASLKEVDASVDDEGGSNSLHTIKGKVRVTNNDTETHDREDINTVNRTEDSTSELTLDRTSAVDSNLRVKTTGGNVTDSDIKKHIKSDDVLTLNTTNTTTVGSDTENIRVESGGIHHKGNNLKTVTEIIDETDVNDLKGKVVNSGQDSVMTNYNSGHTENDSTTKSGSETHNVTDTRTPNLKETDVNTTNYGKTTTNSGRQINDTSEDVYGFGSNEPTGLNKSNSIREDDNLKEELGGIDKNTNTKDITGVDKNVKNDTLTFSNRKDSRNVRMDRDGFDDEVTNHGKVITTDDKTTINRVGDNETKTHDVIDETECRNLTTTDIFRDDTITTLENEGDETRIVDSLETDKEYSTVTTDEDVTTTGGDTTTNTGTETTGVLSETTGSDSLKQTGTVKHDNENVTEYEGYEEETVNTSFNNRKDKMTEDSTGENTQNRTLTHTQETKREADSPLSTTQSLVHEEVEMRMKYNLVDLILESIRKDIALRIWRY